MHRFLLGLVGVVVAASAGAGCGGSSHQSAGCGAPVQEKLDTRSTQHLFPGVPEPLYQTDPPTSGPHQLGPPFTGTVTSPIPRPRQVAMLESGYVLLQYRNLSGTQIGQLSRLAGPLVTVAPAVGPLPSPVVATAWTWKLTCGAAQPAALQSIRTFIAAHKGRGFNP